MLDPEAVYWDQVAEAAAERAALWSGDVDESPVTWQEQCPTCGAVRLRRGIAEELEGVRPLPDGSFPVQVVECFHCLTGEPRP